MSTHHNRTLYNLTKADKLFYFINCLKIVFIANSVNYFFDLCNYKDNL